MATLAKNTIFTNVALTPDGGVWWEGMTTSLRPSASTGRATGGPPRSEEKRGESRASECPLYGSGITVSRPSIRLGKDPNGVPISAFIFGGRRATNIPLVYQAFNWSAGVYVGATMGSEMTAAAAGTIGKVRRDPMAMLPFCGYHMGDYFRHWIKMQRIAQRDAAHFPCELVPQGCRGQVPMAGVR